MNIKSRIALVSLVVAGLSACASTDDRAMYSTPAPAPAPASSIDADAAYIAYVERIARRRGIDVVWVNIPRKKVEPAALE
ncbi:MAG: hypothetical protein M3Q40_04760 [Pseudomonadota bacterium]|nr:hypothetical protein [Pseudomonadota bacterium]